MLVLDMIEVLPPMGKYKYDTWRILPVKCYIDNFVCLQSCIRNINKDQMQVLPILPPGHHITCGIRKQRGQV
jgi:hypothetical protein